MYMETWHHALSFSLCHFYHATGRRGRNRGGDSDLPQGQWDSGTEEDILHARGICVCAGWPAFYCPSHAFPCPNPLGKQPPVLMLPPYACCRDFLRLPPSHPSISSSSPLSSPANRKHCCHAMGQTATTTPAATSLTSLPSLSLPFYSGGHHPTTPPVTGRPAVGRTIGSHIVPLFAL